MSIKVWIQLSAVCVVLSIMAGCGAYEKADAKYQAFADSERVKHLAQIADLLEEYKEKVGHYPLAEQREALKLEDGTFKDEATKKIYEANPEIECLITPRDIPDRIKNRPGSFLRVDYANMNKELSQGLGRAVELPYDPQEVPVYKPNFYVYACRQGEYFLAVHLYKPYAHAAKISENYYKLEVTSMKNHPQKLVNYNEYKKAMAEKSPEPQQK